jgi:hypothetical protein
MCLLAEGLASKAADVSWNILSIFYYGQTFKSQFCTFFNEDFEFAVHHLIFGDIFEEGWNND